MLIDSDCFSAAALDIFLNFKGTTSWISKKHLFRLLELQLVMWKEIVEVLQIVGKVLHTV